MPDWNWKTPTGYILVVGFQIIALYYVLVLSVCNLCGPMGSCFLFIALGSDAQAELQALNKMNETGAKDWEFRKRFFTFIKQQIDSKELSYKSDVQVKKD